MILRSGEPGILPPEFAYRSILLLDPGVSTDHSMFLDAWRKWIRVSVASKCGMDTKKIRPRCYIVHAEEEHAKRYGVGKRIESPVPDAYYDHEVRPRKRNPQHIHHATRERGLAWSMTKMEVNSQKRGEAGPWRFSKYIDDQPRQHRQPLMVLLEPTEKDLAFFSAHERWWHRPDLMPRLWLGAGALGRLPPTFMRWLDGVIALTPSGHQAAYDAFEGLDARAYQIPTDRLLTPKNRKNPPKWVYAFADNWDAGGNRLRSPQMASWLLRGVPMAERAFVPQAGAGDYSATLAEALNCWFYIVVSQDEGIIPYDGVLALAGGATVIAPNVAVWRSVKGISPGKVLLYPVRQTGNNRCAWNAVEVSAFVQATLKKRAKQWP